MQPDPQSCSVPPRRRRRRWGRWFLVSLVATILSAYLAREALLAAAGRALIVDTAVAPADYLVVLGGDAEIRPFAAADLYRRGIAPRVLIFEYPSDHRRTAEGVMPQSVLYRRILELEGVHPSAIQRVPGVTRNSWEEAIALRRFLLTQPAARVVIVTSAEHTRRARWTYRQALSGLPVDVRMAPARHLNFDETNWWRRDEGVLLYLHEFLKLPFYRAYYLFGGEV